MDKKLNSLPVPSPTQNNQSKGGEFIKGLKWSLGINIGCCGFSALFFGLIFTFFAFIGFLAAGFQVSSPDNMQESSISGFGPDKIAVINITGEIVSESGNSFLDPLVSSSSDIKLQLQKASDDKTVKAIVLRIDSPGGAVTASDEIYQKVKEMSGEKKVIASFGNVAASGGYYVATSAHKIFANPATITGSIGVIISIPNMEGLYEKIGYKETIIKSGEFKDLGSSSRLITEKEKAIFQSLIDESYLQFIQIIASGRNMDLEKVKILADGRIYSGRQAKELNLIDELGTLEDAIEEAKKLANIKNAQIIEYKKSFWEEFSGASYQAIVKLNPFNSYKSFSRLKVEYKWVD